MKKLSALIGFFFLALGSVYGEPTEELDSNNVVETIATVEIAELAFEFKNDKDKLTLVPFETGKVTFTWSNIKTADEYFGIKYQIIEGGDWKEVTALVTDETLVIEDLKENNIFRYHRGTGSESNIAYGSETFHFNTISSTIFKNHSSKGKEEAADLMFAIEHNKLDDILTIYPDATYTVKYNTKIGEKQNKADDTKSPWMKEEQISINKVKYKLKELIGGEDYVYKVGLNLGDQVIWSDKGKVKTERSWGIFKLLVLIGALGMFIFGMKIMSEGLQKAAGSRLRNMLGSITSNRVKGVFTGFGITSIVQSSSVTTVMTVSFVNAGLMTLRQSAGVMMGANIGTTITAWLILLFGFKVSLSSYALIFIAFGAPMLFFSKGKTKMWASVIIGFALLFMGLGELKHAVPSLGADSSIVQFFVDFKDVWYGPIMFVILGALVTVVIQSSSAAMALTMTMVAGGVIPFEVASAMILGENIGTTITAELASLIGNVHAKRSARIHSLFNVIGVGWAILLFPFILKGIAGLIEGDPYTDGSAANLGLAIFHSAFNLMNVLILIWFVPWLVKVAERTVKSKGGADEEFHLDYIGTGIMGTPDLSILEAKKEVAKFGEITTRMSTFAQQLLTEQNKKAKSKLHEKMAKYEEITDRVEIEVANYLAKVSEGEMSEETSIRVRSMNAIVNDLERIGDIFYQMSKAIERKDEKKAYFLPEQRESLMEMFSLVDEAFVTMVENLNADWEGVTIDKAAENEAAINKKRNELRKAHLQNLGSTNFDMESGMVFSNLFSSCEKVGDHIINVTEAIVGRIN
ncbi:MAG: Na/Pi cotransporter family protein [Crocinitomicaceae bacterium]